MNKILTESPERRKKDMAFVVAALRLLPIRINQNPSEPIRIEPNCFRSTIYLNINQKYTKKVK